MPLRLEQITEDNCRPWLNLLQLYLHELSSFKADIAPDDEARFEFSEQEACLRGGETRAYYVVVKDKVAGFMVVKDEPDGSLDLPHYFILNGYRGLGLGKDAALMAFDQWHGRWRVAAPESSSQARAFWRRVIRGLTRKHYRVTHDRPNALVFYEFIYPPLDDDAAPHEALTQTADSP